MTPPRREVRLGLIALGAAALLLASHGLWRDASAAPPAPPEVTVPKVELGDPMTADGQARREAAKLGRRHTASPLVLPDQTIPIRFSHAVHLAKNMQCADCHGKAAESVRARDVLLPRERVCLDCHDITRPDAKPKSACSTCHPGFSPTWLPDADRTRTRQVTVHPPAVVIPEPHLKFNHKVHLDRGVSCAACHGDLAKVDLATRENALPLMGTCLGCHDGEQAPDRCDTCHEAQPDGRVRTNLPGGKLVPGGWYFQDAHDDAWLRSHRFASTLGENSCAACHTQKDCIDCHNGVKKPLSVHPNNWILTHPVAARKDAPSCASCHRSQTYCMDCHQQAKVSPDVPNRPLETVRFHPDGWVEGVGQRSPQHHAFEAQRNIRSCASCHSEQSCLQCHSTATLGVNPHPPGFGGAACERMRDKNARVCAKCHTPGSSAMDCR